MKLLVSYIVAKNCQARLARTLKFQKLVFPESEQIEKLFVIEEDQELPVHGSHVVRMPMFEGEYFLASKAKNAAIDYATKHGYEWLLDADADTVMLNKPTNFPETGYGCMRCHMTKEGQNDQDILMDMAAGRVKFEYGARFLTRRDVFTKCRYHEELKGYAGEDLDYDFTVIGHQGIKSSDSNMFGLHLWHPSGKHAYVNDHLRDHRSKLMFAAREGSKLKSPLTKDELWLLAEVAFTRHKIVDFRCGVGSATKSMAMMCPGTVYAIDDTCDKDLFASNMRNEIVSSRAQLLQMPLKEAMRSIGKVDMIFTSNSSQDDVEILKAYLASGGTLYRYTDSLVKEV